MALFHPERRESSACDVLDGTRPLRGKLRQRGKTESSYRLCAIVDGATLPEAGEHIDRAAGTQLVESAVQRARTGRVPECIGPDIVVFAAKFECRGRGSNPHAPKGTGF
jgi:hypothetical protein